MSVFSALVQAILALQALLLPRSVVAVSTVGGLRCPCVGNLAAWDFTLEEAMYVSDVVLLGRIAQLTKGLRGTMNATLSSFYTYKAHSQFPLEVLSQIHGVTNFRKGADTDRTSLFFLMLEPTGNLALQCMTPLLPSLDGNGGNDLLAILDFVFRSGIQANEKNELLDPEDPNPCDSISPPPCNMETAYCSVTNILPGNSFKCVCWTGYVGDGVNCDILEEPTPPSSPPTSVDPSDDLADVATPTSAPPTTSTTSPPPPITDPIGSGSGFAFESESGSGDVFPRSVFSDVSKGQSDVDSTFQDDEDIAIGQRRRV